MSAWGCCFPAKAEEGGEKASWSTGASWRCCSSINDEEIEVRVDASDEPLVGTWSADLEKAACGKLGMEITPLENVLKVERIQLDGAVVDYNSTHPSQAIRPGDYITTVNGVSGSAIKMLAELRKELRRGGLRVALARSRTFRAAVTKAGPLGATFGVFKQVLVVQEIKEGPLQEWNRRHPSCLIEVGDQILEVNGTKGVSTEISEAMKQDGELSIFVLPLGGAGSS